MKKFLLTGFYFEGYHGSMMHICEIAKYLKTQNYDVYIASMEITEEIKNYTKSLGLDLYYVYDLPLNVNYDYVLSYHFPLLTWLLGHGLKYDKLMYGSLSSFCELESPHFCCKYNVPMHIHSNECKDKFIEEYKMKPSSFYIMQNLVPAEYDICKYVPREELKNIAIVSNHCPEELRKSVDIFALQKINVDIYEKNDIYMPITPELLNRYDVVITIGKTVQYALVLGIPVYNYDYFGGSGYITLENMDREESYNYSGRSSCRKVSTENIVCEIGAYYSKVLKQMSEIKKIANERYNIRTNINNLIKYMDNLPHIDLKDSLKNDKLYYKYCTFFIEEITNLWKLREKCIIPYGRHTKYYLKYFIYSKLLKNKKKAKKYEILLGRSSLYS